MRRVVEAVVEHAGEAGDPLVLRAPEAQAGGERGVGGAPEDRRHARVRHGLGHRADGHDRAAPQAARRVDQHVGETAHPQVGLHAGEHHEVPGAVRVAGDQHLVVRPADPALVVLVEVGLGALLREVEVRVGVDGGGDGDRSLAEHPVERAGRGARGVERTPQSDDEDGVAQRADRVPVRLDLPVGHVPGIARTSRLMASRRAPL